MATSTRTQQEIRTSAPPAEVLQRAKRFFARNQSIYTAYIEREGPEYVTLRGQGGEELILHAATVDGATRVTGSSYLFDAQIGRFFSTLPPAGGAA
jgi:hypothetical protein